MSFAKCFYSSVVHSSMKLSCIAILALSIPSCAVPSATAWDAPSSNGPVLVGVLRQPNGTPMANVLVTPHSGFATRFPGTPTRTNQEGRYRFDLIHGSWMESESGTGSDIYVGVCIGENESSGNPAETLPWKDARIINVPGIVKRLDFMFDPSVLELNKLQD